MISPRDLTKLSRREREMMDIVFAKKRATVADVLEAMASPPSYSAVRATLATLERKGFLAHESDGPSYVYVPTLPKAAASKSVLRRVVDTFFGGSAEQAMAALLDVSDARLSDQEKKRILAMIRKAEEEGK
jgi:BlaI family penicillinase repressor